MNMLKVSAFGAAGAALTAVIAHVTVVCPDLASQWPAIATAGLTAALGFWLRSPKDKA